MKEKIAWMRVQCQDALELFLLPGLAVFLPWPWCFWLYKQLAKWPRLYRQAIAEGYANAKQSLPALDEMRWCWERRLISLVDHADLMLSCTRSRRWLDRHVQVKGQWPLPDQTQLICTFHWGAGMWSLPSLRGAGLMVHGLAASLDSAQFKGRPVLHLYARWRTGRVVQILGLPTIDVSASMRPVIKAIKAKQSLLAVVDVPADNFGASVSVQLLGQSIAVPRGFLRLAADRELPVTIFLAGLNFQTGQRELAIHQLGAMSDSQALFDNVFQFLDDAIRLSPGAWHLWAEMPRFTSQNH